MSDSATVMRTVGRSLARNYLWVILVAVVITLSIISPSFRAVANYQNILMQNGMIGIVALGMLVMMISGGFDLSVGAIGGAVAVVAATVSGNFGIGIAAIVGLLLGTALGSINGFIIAKLRINSFITTFAVASVVSGIMFVFTNGKSISGKSSELQTFAFGKFLAIPNMFWAFLVVAIITYLLLTRTKWGHWIYSSGANEQASYLSGIPVTWVKASAFVFGGFATAIGALLMFGQSGIGQPTGADAWPLNAIAICVIGGTALAGGVGRVSDVVAATLLLGVISNGMNQLGISPYWQPAVTGAIILAAVIGDQLGRSRGSGH